MPSPVAPWAAAAARTAEAAASAAEAAVLRVFFFILALGLTMAAGAAGHAEPRGPMGQGCAPNC